MWDKIQRFAGDRIDDIKEAYNNADLAVDGWLPGGAKQSPLTQTYQENSQDPGYSIEEPKVNLVPGLNADTPIVTEDKTLTPKAKEFVRHKKYSWIYRIFKRRSRRYKAYSPWGSRLG